MKHFSVNLLYIVAGTVVSGRFTPDWPSLDSRPLPTWYDQAKFGIFVHWGPYSVPGVVSEWFWFYWHRNDPTKKTDVEANKFMQANYPKTFTYQEFGPQFSAQFFNASQWVDIVSASGARYFVLTSKHHDGFANWPSSRNFGWTSRDTGPGRDVVGELQQAFRRDGGVRFGLYHSLFEWFNPLFLQDKANNFTTREYVKTKMMPELRELVETYQPDILWSDGDCPADVSPVYWGSREFLAWLYNDSPVKDTVVTNDRWGSGTAYKHGDFYSGADRYNPGTLQLHKWENAMTVDRRSWGFRRTLTLSDLLTEDDLLASLASTVSCGGNLLLNVGPNSDGIISPIFEERLRNMGRWLAWNGEAIYSSRPWSEGCQNDTVTRGVWYTTKHGDGTKNIDRSSHHKINNNPVVFAIVLSWPTNNALELGCINPAQNTMISLLTYEHGPLKWRKRMGGGIIVRFPDQTLVRGKWAYVLRFEKLAKNP